MIRRLATAVIATAVLGLPIPVPAVAASDWPAAETYLAVPGCAASSTQQACLKTRVLFVEYYERAKLGDRDAQFAVATCLSQGCFGSVTIDRVAACAWRMVMLTKDPSEKYNKTIRLFRSECGQLDDNSKRRADDLASGLLSKLPGTD